MNGKAAAQVSGILVAGLVVAYGLSLSLGSGRRARAGFDPKDFRQPEFIVALAEPGFERLDRSRVRALVYLSGMNGFFTDHSSAFDKGECAQLARKDLGAVASRAVYETLGWTTRKDTDPEVVLSTFGAVSRRDSAVVLSAQEVDAVRRDGVIDGKVLGVKYLCSAAPVRRLYDNAVSYVHNGVAAQPSPSDESPAQPRQAQRDAPVSPASQPQPNPFAQFDQLPKGAAPPPRTSPPAPDPFAQFGQLPQQAPGGSAPGGGPGPRPPQNFNPRDFQRFDIIQHLHAGSIEPLEQHRVAVQFYLVGMNQFFMDQSALFDDGSCTTLADPRLGIVAAQAMYKSLEWGSLERPNLEGMAKTLGPLLQGMMENPGGMMLAVAEIDILKRQGEMDGKILALRYQCSSPGVRTLYENAKRFVYR